MSGPKRRGFIGLVGAELGLIAGAITAALFLTVGKAWLTDLDDLPWTGLMFVWLFGTMIWCAFGVVRHAEALAELLGEPYGTLILTIAVISMEVAVLATVMLGGEPNPTLPRETMFAILMIVLNGMVGMTLAIGAIRHVQQEYNLQGATAFLAVISALAIIALVVPTFSQSTEAPTFTPAQAVVFGLLTALLYAAFLVIQTTRHRHFFVEPQGKRAQSAAEPVPHPHGELHSASYHAILLIATVLPVVLLSKPLAKLLDFGVERMGLPTALGGIIVAILILAPEGVAALQAAARNQLQRAVNLSLGSALSTIGLTVPVVLAISVWSGSPLELGLRPLQIVLLAITLFLCQMTFSGRPTNILLSFVHLVLFLAYLMLVFHP